MPNIFIIIIRFKCDLEMISIINIYEFIDKINIGKYTKSMCKKLFKTKTIHISISIIVMLYVI